MPSLPTVMPGTIILNGENPFIWLYDPKDETRTTEASIWTVTYSEKGAGHVLFIKSELTDNNWRIYSDNPALARWLQDTVQGMLSPESSDKTIPVIASEFSRHGSVQDSWTQVIQSAHDTVVMTWYGTAQPVLVQDEKVSEPDRPYGVSAVMIPAQSAKLTLNDVEAQGTVVPMDLNGHPFSTAALAFSENWRIEED